MYTPPFTISARAINLIAEITALIERYVIRMEQEDTLLLRKINRVKTIQGSLAIEGNTLTESQITDIIEGKHVVAPVREIIEVKNAIRTYNLFSTLNPFRLEDMLKAHAIMMEALVDDAGCFRKGGVGVFAGSRMIHMAPPADRVLYLMKDLLEWLEKAEDHLLLRSCVFHYEFEFIHPFSDGNGRIGRLWQSLILAKLNPLFEHLPVENMVFANQQAYYDAINQSSAKADSGAFIDFMLQEICNTLRKRQEDSMLKDVLDVGINVGNDVGINVGNDVGINVGINEAKVLAMLRKNNRLTVKEVAESLTVSLRQVERIFASLKKKKLISRIGGNRLGHWEVLEN